MVRMNVTRNTFIKLATASLLVAVVHAASGCSGCNKSLELPAPDPSASPPVTLPETTGTSSSTAPAPTVGSVTATNGPLGGGTTITITGTGFSSGATVTVGGSACTSVNVASATTITCVTPTHAAGAVDVVVSNADGQGATKSSGYTYNPVPTFTNISPNAGRTQGSTAVTITGTGFISGATVVFGSSACTSVNVASSTQITCITPSNAAGSVNVVVTNPDTQGATGSGAYIYRAGPNAISISPSGGNTSGGTAVTITGDSFAPSGVTVSIGGTNCGSLTVVSSTQINCTTGAHAAGTVSVVVDNNDSSTASTITNAFVYRPPPTVSSITPTSGSTMGNHSVTIGGTDFVASPTVAIGGSTCAVTAANATSITCTTSSHAAGLTTVVVTNNDGQNSNAYSGYTYKSFMYVAGNGSDSLSALVVNSSTGALANVTGSPFTDATMTAPTAVAVVPGGAAAGKYLLATYGSLKKVSTWSINAETSAITYQSQITTGTTGDGGNPAGVVLDPAGKFVYSANYGPIGTSGGSISAYTLNTSTGALTSVSNYIVNTAIQNHPQALAVAPSGNFLYVANNASDNVSVYSINSTTGALTEISGSPFSADTGGRPQFVAISPNGSFLYVSNNALNYIKGFTVNTSTGALTAMGSTFATGTSPVGIAINPAGTFLYTANSDTTSGNSVSAYTINSSTGALTQVSGSPYSTGQKPQSLAVDPTGGYLYIANYNGNNVTAYPINTSTGQLNAQLGGSPFADNTAISNPIYIGFTPL